MVKYECIRNLYLDEYDDDDLFTDNSIEVKKGTIWFLDEDCTYRHVAGNDAFRLVRETDTNREEWIEIYSDTLDEFFAEI